MSREIWKISRPRIIDDNFNLIFNIIPSIWLYSIYSDLWVTSPEDEKVESFLFLPRQGCLLRATYWFISPSSPPRDLKSSKTLTPVDTRLPEDFGASLVNEEIFLFLPFSSSLLSVFISCNRVKNGNREYWIPCYRIKTRVLNQNLNNPPAVIKGF